MAFARPPLALALLLACSSPQFEDDFDFGVAIAGFQVEMGCPTIAPEVCEDRGSDWYAFVTSTVTQARASNHLANHPPTYGPGYFELYEADIARAASLGVSTYRFSLEWSRVFPASTRGVDDHEALLAIASKEALERYRAQLRAIRSHGLSPLVTLNHYTLPSWVHDGVGCNVGLDECAPRGWLEPWIVDEIAKYSGFVAKELGPEIDVWATQNEPMAVILPGYIMPTAARTNPPAQTLRLKEARVAMNAMIEAHARMSDAVHAADPGARVGLVYAVAPVHPMDEQNALDRLAAKNVHYLMQDAFLDAIALGKLDEDLDGRAERVERLEGRLDFLGVNYYTRVKVRGTDDAVLPELSVMSNFDPLSLEQGEVYAPGIHESLIDLMDRYPGLPIIVTENGASSENDMSAFLVDHLDYLLRALEEGAPVEGYLWWTLIDNYEWNHGMEIRMGLFAVDPLDPLKQRVERPVAKTYRKVIETREL
ncbi:MAG: glycoside hydrolase family 1 protein [Deltaproteobacteria bacterium]|nr:glycoside hydrolase family 1 protein [Deltaproteobacteria bacterium]